MENIHIFKKTIYKLWTVLQAHLSPFDLYPVGIAPIKGV